MKYKIESVEEYKRGFKQDGSEWVKWKVGIGTKHPVNCWDDLRDRIGSEVKGYIEKNKYTAKDGSEKESWTLRLGAEKSIGVSDTQMLAGLHALEKRVKILEDVLSSNIKSVQSDTPEDEEFPL